MGHVKNRGERTPTQPGDQKFLRFIVPAGAVIDKIPLDRKGSSMKMPDISFEQWMAYGIRKGWCGPPVCYTHDGLPSTSAEDDDWIDGGEPCIHVVRMYEGDEQKAAVEENHSPSVWRNRYTEESAN